MLNQGPRTGPEVTAHDIGAFLAFLGILSVFLLVLGFGLLWLLGDWDKYPKR